MNTSQKSLLEQRVNEVLYYIWDPIGVNDAPEARDEYDSYVPDIVDALLNKESEEEIAKQLYDIEVNSMEINGNLEQCKLVASLLCHWLVVVND